MSLRSKVVLFVLGVSLLFAGTSYLIQRNVIQPGFAEVEANEARDDLARCEQAILHDAQFVSNSANDYAAWDDTYRFIEDVNEEYQSENLIPETFQNLKLHLFAFIRKDGTLIWGRLRMPQQDELVEHAEVIGAFARADHTLVAHPKPDSKLFGLVRTPLGPMLVGSAPITTSDRTGEVRGAVIMGRLLTDALTQEIAERTRVALAVYSLEHITEDYRTALAQVEGGDDMWIDDSDRSQLVGYTLIRDIDENPAVLLRAHLPRKISQRGASAAALAGVMTVASGVGSTVFMWFVLSFLFVRPLTRLTQHAVRVGAEDDLQARLNLTLRDEIGVLAREFDRMVNRLAESRAQLVAVARNAGMAQVATNVLHNVGNVLNGVNVSTEVLREQLRKSEIASFQLAVKMLADHREELPDFLTRHEQGRQLPAFLMALAEQLSAEQQSMTEEVKSLAAAVDHIRKIVSTQQQYTRHDSLLERASPKEVMETALSLCADSLNRHRIQVTRCFDEGAPVTMDKHRTLQILVNLLTNAIQAVKESERENRLITARVARTSPDDCSGISFVVEDNGIGIPPENLERIFALGFTTRPDGHGVGLHSAANLAREMSATLTAASDGPGRGAYFELSLTPSEVKVET